jgi:hypothetical protein
MREEREMKTGVRERRKQKHFHLLKGKKMANHVYVLEAMKHKDLQQLAADSTSANTEDFAVFNLLEQLFSKKQPLVLELQVVKVCHHLEPNRRASKLKRTGCKQVPGQETERKVDKGICCLLQRKVDRNVLLER